MTEADSTHIGGRPEQDPARRGGTIGAGLVPDEAVEGAMTAQVAEDEQARGRTAAAAVGSTASEGLVEPDGVASDGSTDR